MEIEEVRKISDKLHDLLAPYLLDSEDTSIATGVLDIYEDVTRLVHDYLPKVVERPIDTEQQLDDLTVELLATFSHVRKHGEDAEESLRGIDEKTENNP